MVKRGMADISYKAVLPGSTSYRGRGATISYGYHQTPAGEILLARNGDKLCYLGFAVDGDREFPMKELRAHFPYAQFAANDDGAMAARVEKAWNGQGGIALELHGTPFQISVWQTLLDIPFGRTMRYQDIAARIGSPKAARAVGGAVGSNPVSLLVPCHRVLPASGGVGNYLWGADVKRKLLELESQHIPH